MKSLQAKKIINMNHYSILINEQIIVYKQDVEIGAELINRLSLFFFI